MDNKTALIAGATGLVGGQLLNLLLNDTYYERVIAITRKPVNNKSDKLVNVLVDFNKLDEYASQMKADDVFCCLGTTMKKAGGKDKFKQVDFTYPVEIAKLALNAGAGRFLLISALGADRDSSIFYNQVKGEVEEAIAKLNYDSYHIFRPALLIGPRDEERLGEDAAKTFFKIFGFLFIGPLKKYKAIDSAKVARAMHAIAKQNLSGMHIHESKELQKY